MAKGKPMLAEYLASEQAREDVRARINAALGTADEPWTLKVPGVGELAIAGTCGPFMKLVIWKKTDEDADDEDAEYIQLCAAYYRPDGDRYVVTDLGEGVRALRLRTGCTHHKAMERSDPMREALRTSGIGNVWSAERGIMELDSVTPFDLPSAICRVMLASMRVAQS
jgi:hypothetical protein